MALGIGATNRRRRDPEQYNRSTRHHAVDDRQGHLRHRRVVSCQLGRPVPKGRTPRGDSARRNEQEEIERSGREFAGGDCYAAARGPALRVRAKAEATRSATWPRDGERRNRWWRGERRIETVHSAVPDAGRSSSSMTCMLGAAIREGRGSSGDRPSPRRRRVRRTCRAHCTAGSADRLSSRSERGPRSAQARPRSPRPPRLPDRSATWPRRGRPG